MCPDVLYTMRLNHLMTTNSPLSPSTFSCTQRDSDWKQRQRVFIMMKWMLSVGRVAPPPAAHTHTCCHTCWSISSTHLLYSHSLLPGLHLSHQVHPHHRNTNMAGDVGVLLLLHVLLLFLLLSRFGGGGRGLHLRICLVRGRSLVELLMGLCYSGRVSGRRRGWCLRCLLSHWADRGRGWRSGGGSRRGWSNGGSSVALLWAGCPGFDKVKEAALPGFTFFICAVRRAGGRTFHWRKSRGDSTWWQDQKTLYIYEDLKANTRKHLVGCQHTTDYLLTWVSQDEWMNPEIFCDSSLCVDVKTKNKLKKTVMSL